MTRTVFWLLAGANFAVALGYGAILPLLPTLLATLERVGTSAAVARHTGALLGTYMLGLFASAPLWGVLVDRIGGRRLLVFGLVAYAAALLAFAVTDSLPAAYVWRVAAGIAGGAILPVVNTTIGAVTDRAVRARLFAGVGVATLLGLLAGPAASGLVYGAMERMGDVRQMTGAVIGHPLAGAAAFALLMAFGCATGLGGRQALHGTSRSPSIPEVRWRQAFPALAASFLLLLGLGAFEAVLPILGQRVLSLGPPALGALLALCMVAMLTVQAVMFLAPILHRAASGRSVFGGFVVVAAGVGVLAGAHSLAFAVLAVVLIGAGGAFLQPAIAYFATLNDAGSSGTLLGALTGAGSLGQAVGSLAGGALFAVLDSRGLWLVAATLALGAVGIAKAMTHRDSSEHNDVIRT